MRRQNSVPLLPLFAVYLLALAYFAPATHQPFAAAHPFFPFSRSRNPPSDTPAQPPVAQHPTADSPYSSLEQSLRSGQTKLDDSLLELHNLHDRLRDHDHDQYRYPHHHHQDHGNKGKEDEKEQVLTLRHVLHHGGVRYPKLFRQKDLRLTDVLLSEMLTGQSLTHRIKTAKTTTLKPKDEYNMHMNSIKSNNNKQNRRKASEIRSQGFRTFDDTSLGPESWTRETVSAPDVEDRETIIQLAKMNYNSYTEVASPGWYDLEGQWTV
ncbi:hypothetical protein BG004_004675, partial [Podila humilis]